MDNHGQRIPDPSAGATAYWKTEQHWRRLANQAGMNLPSWISCILHTMLYAILPFLLFTTLIIAGSILISYSIYLAKPVPVHFVVAISSAFAGLILTGVAVHIIILVKGARALPPSGKDTEARTDRNPRPAAPENVQIAQSGPVANVLPTSGYFPRPHQPQSSYLNRGPTIPEIPSEPYPAKTAKYTEYPHTDNRESVELSAVPTNVRRGGSRRAHHPSSHNLKSSYPLLNTRQATPHPSLTVTSPVMRPNRNLTAPKPDVSPLTPTAVPTVPAAAHPVHPRSLRAGWVAEMDSSLVPDPLKIQGKFAAVDERGRDLPGKGRETSPVLKGLGKSDMTMGVGEGEGGGEEKGAPHEQEASDIFKGWRMGAL